MRRYAPLLALSGIAFAMSFVIRHEVFFAFSWNRDEPVFLWQYNVLRAGQFTATDGGAPEFFHPWLSGAADGEFFAQYTLGWPLALLVAGIVFGSPGFAVALATSLVVAGTYALTRELFGDHTLALVVAALMTAAPIVVIHSGMYIGYLFSFALGLFFASALLAGIRRRRMWLVVVAGVLLGAVFLTRPYDAVLWAVPFAAYLLYTHRDNWRLLVRGLLWLVVGALPFVLMGVAYNKRITGSFTEFPITAKEPLDSFGFGEHRIMPNWPKENYTVGRALRATAKNLTYGVVFLPGSIAGLVIAAVALWFRRRDQRMLALLALAAAFPIGYFFFWGTSVSSAQVSLTGPIYLLPIYGPLCILIGLGIVDAWRHRRRLGIAVVVLIAAVTVPVLLDRANANRDISLGQERWRESEDEVRGRALVFVEPSIPYLMQMNPFTRNGPHLDDRVLWAVDRGAENFDLIASESDRTPYRQLSVIEETELAPDRVSVQRLHVGRGTTVALHVRITNPTDQPVVVAYLDIEGRFVSKTIDTASSKGAVIETEWIVGVEGSVGADATLTNGSGTFTVGTSYSSNPEEAVSARRAEERLTYRVDGGAAEVLSPGVGYRLFLAGGLTPRRADTSAELEVIARR